MRGGSVIAIFVVSAVPLGAAPPKLIESSGAVGLADRRASRVQSTDLDLDGRPDLILEYESVLLNRAAPRDASDGAGFRFEAIDAGLDGPGKDGVSIFVDVDGDRVPDAIVARSLGATTWQRGRGDGRFDAAQPIDAARAGTVSSIAAGDVDRDGRVDLLIGRWYRAYGESLEAFPADLLLNRADGDGRPRFERVPLPEDDATFDEERDAAGRPLYGVMIATLLDRAQAAPPQLAMLAYGRRANRLYARSDGGAASGPTESAPARSAASPWRDLAPELRFDGDDERSGRYPEWLRERAKSDPRFDRQDEKPFRAHGNTFDMAVGDVDGDGRFDAALAEITHAWAGPSSDRSRVLFARDGGFEPSAAYSLDRVPAGDGPDARRWNQGDLFVELADVDLDGRLDVILASGDYPDPPPFDERLRIFLQRSAPDESGRRLVDATAALGVDLPGCGQIALADFDLDGRVDVAAGQSFTRFTPAMIEAAGGSPRVRLFLNRRAASDAPPPSTEAATPSAAQFDPNALVLELVGDPSCGIAAVPFGAIVEVRTASPNGATVTQTRQLVGPGGHAGKQSAPIIHVGLGDATDAFVRVHWPCERPIVSEWQPLSAGRHVIRP